MRLTAIVVSCLLACALPFVLHSCKKDDGPSIPDGAQYTKNMGGLRMWSHHKHHESCTHPEFNVDTTYAFHDSVRIVSDVSVFFLGTLLPFSKHDAARHIVTFGRPGVTSGFVLFYNYDANNISYSITSHTGACSDNSDDGHTM